jgi:hypothetical protein
MISNSIIASQGLGQLSQVAGKTQKVPNGLFIFSSLLGRPCEYLIAFLQLLSYLYDHPGPEKREHLKVCGKLRVTGAWIYH